MFGKGSIGRGGSSVVDTLDGLLVESASTEVDMERVGSGSLSSNGYNMDLWDGRGPNSRSVVVGCSWDDEDWTAVG